MANKSLVTIYTPKGETISGVYIGTPDDFRATFHGYKLNTNSQSLGINLRCANGGFVRVPIDMLCNCIHRVEPILDIEEDVMKNGNEEPM